MFKTKFFMLSGCLITSMLISLTQGVCSEEKQDSDEALALKITNPVANLITIPFQMNFDNNIGSDDNGSKILTNVQPVIPFDLGDDWNVISRTIMPVVYQEDIF